MSDQPSSADPGAPTKVTLAQKLALRDALDAVPILYQEALRRKLVRELAEAGVPLDSADTARDTATFDLLAACIRVPSGLAHLVTALKLIGGSTPECLVFERVVHDLWGDEDLPPADASNLRVLLGTVAPVAHENALRHGSFSAYRTLLTERSLAGPDAARPVLAAFDRLQALPEGTEALVIYLELIGHQLEAAAADDVHQHVDALVTAVPHCRATKTRLCAALQESAKVGPGVRAEKSISHHISGSVQAGDGESMITVTVREPESANTAEPTTIWGGVPPRNLNFTGRKQLLEKIRAKLSSHDEATLVPQALHGLGGVGKTELAIEFAYRFQDQYRLIWWILSDDERAMRRSLVSLSKRLGLPETADADDAIAGVLDALRRGQPHADWLLIYDNAGDPDQLQRYRPVDGKGHVIITSRSARWQGQSEVLSVDVFSPEESRALLGRRWPDLVDAEALTLANRLGHLPLALEQAAAVHEQSGMTLAEYLTALDETPAEVMIEGAPSGYASSVGQTFRIAYRELKSSAESAAQLFALCALMGSQAISVDILVRGRAANALPAPLAGQLRQDITRRRAIREMADHSLVQLDPRRNLISIHSLVRDLARAELSDDERRTFEQAAHAVLALANPGDPDNPGNWPWLAQINPHVVPSGIVLSGDPEARTAFLDQVRYLYAIGDYAGSQALGEMAVANWTANLGPDDEMTLVANRHLANSLRELGEYGRVREINAATLDRMRRTLGKDHEHTLATANSAAADLRLVGEFSQAMALDKANYELSLQALGEDELGTQRAANNLAVDYRLLGRFADALAIDEDNVRRRSSLLGEDHPRTLSSYVGLVRDYMGLGAYRRALALQQEKLALHRARLPEYHAEVLRARRNVAVLQRKIGDVADALESARANFEVYRTRFGDRHEQTFASTLTMCNTLRAAGDLDAALEFGRRAKSSYLEAFGADHPLTAVAQVDLAIVLRGLGDLPAAQAENSAALALLTEKLGGDHPWTICALTNQANIVAAQGDATKALALSQEALIRSRRVRGEDHPNSLACAANVALDLLAAGNGLQSFELRRDTLARMRAQLGEDHPDVLNASKDGRSDCDIEPPPM